MRAKNWLLQVMTLAPTLLMCLVPTAFALEKAKRPVAITHYQSNSYEVPPDFLDYARSAGYEYVIVQGSLSDTNVTSGDEWQDGVYAPPPGNGKLFEVLRREFVKGAQHGIKIIPFFQIGNRHSNWSVTAPSIKHNDTLEPEYKLEGKSENLGGEGHIKFLSLDINHDGISEIVQLWNNGGRLGIEVYSFGPCDKLVNPTCLGAYYSSWANTRTDLKDWCGAGALTHLDWCGANALEFFVADVDGDGNDDILRLWDNSGRLGIEVYSSDGTSYHLTWSNAKINLDLGGAGAMQFFVANVNNDPYPDIVQLWDTKGQLGPGNGQLGMEVYTSDGTGFQLSWSNTWTGQVLGEVTHTKFLTGDFNDDNYTDILKVGDTGEPVGLEVYASDGNGYYLASSSTWTDLDLDGANAIDYLAGDANGDGRTDLLQFWDNNGRMGLEVYTAGAGGYSHGWSNTWDHFKLGGSTVLKLVPADVDGDAHTDVLMYWDDMPNLGFAIYRAAGGGPSRSVSYTLSWGSSLPWGGEPSMGDPYLDVLTGHVVKGPETDFVQLWARNGRLGASGFAATPKPARGTPYAACGSADPQASPPCGLERSFESYLTVVRDAYEEARKEVPTLGEHLDYLNIGHDEIATGASYELLIAASSPEDQAYISTFKKPADGYYALIADEIVRRVEAVKRVLGNETKSLIYADAFDPQANGGRDVYGWTEAGGPRSIILHTKEVINYSINGKGLDSVKNDLVLVPWQYRTTYDINLMGPRPYDAGVTLGFFQQNGFKVMPGTAYGEADLTDSRTMMAAWVDASQRPEFEEAVAGFVGHNWLLDKPYWSGASSSPDRFLVVPELAKKAGFYPLNGFLSFNVNHEVSVTIDKFVLERIVGVSNDPFVEVNINGLDRQYSEVATNVRERETVIPEPNVFTQSVDLESLASSVVPISLSLWDYDQIGANDRIDINPSESRKSLGITYSVSGKTVTPPSPRRGDDAFSRARIYYEVGSGRSGSFSSQLAGCPADFAGTYRFDTTLTNRGGEVVEDLQVVASELTGGSLLLVQGDLVEQGDAMNLYPTRGHQLDKSQSEVVPFVVCLKTRDPFALRVNVIGKVHDLVLAVPSNVAVVTPD